MGFCCSVDFNYVSVSMPKMASTMCHSELKLLEWERSIGLCHMYYDEFEEEIMRYGFSGLITEITLEKISRRIPFKLKELDIPDTISAGYLHNSLVFKRSYYRLKTKNFLQLGILFCSKKSRLETQDSLWALINPEVTQWVHRTKVQ